MSERSENHPDDGSERTGEERSNGEGAHPLVALTPPLDVRSVATTGIFVLLFFYTLYFGRPFFLPVVIAILLSFLLAPAMRFLGRLGIPTGISAGILILGLIFGVGYGAYRLSGPAAEWLDRAPHAIRHVERRVRDLQRPVESVREAAERVEREVGQMAGRERAQKVEVQDGTFTGAVLDRTWSFLGSAAVMLVLLFFLLASGDLFLRKLVRVLPRLADKKRAIEIARKTERQISTYLFTFTLINVGLAIAVAVAMRLAGLPNPVLWGALAGILNFIPYLGPIVTASVISLVSFLTFDEPGRAMVAPAVYVAINFLESSLVTPSMLGRRLALNPVVVFVGLIFWGWLWGVPGALLAVPVLATFKIFCEHIEPLAPIGEFLGP